ncbi:kinase RLK-Pelle-CrRLK1L-1 family protein [Tanacetum coccineum]
MEAFLEQFKDVLTKIPMEEIIKATNNFHKDNFIGGGGFGKVYKGILSGFKEQNTVAFKRLDRQNGQGEAEFYQEIMMLSLYRHEYLISLMGFCKEGDAMILVYEHASNGSLDAHLKSADLTWTQRLKICLQAAKGLRYLHDPNGTSQRLIHRDIKSANILLDDKWNAKIADFGLSKIGPANQKYSFLFENPAGTFGYCDPLYITTKTLTKESDVYSFGVVLFEVLCGKLCFTYDIDGVYKVFVHEWIDSYDNKNLKGIIFEGMIKQKLDSSSLKLFSDIAYQCLKESREERPKMDDVVEQLEIALGLQDYEETLTDAVAPDISEEDHRNARLSKGILIDEGKTWFSVDEKRKHCEMISVLECLVPIPSESASYKSRFAGGFYEASKLLFKTHVRTKFLSPLTTYTVNLIFKDKKPKERYIGLEYSLEGGKKCYSFLSDVREDGWFTAELYQFKSDQRTVDLQILFYLKYCPNLLIEGIEFRPTEEVEHATLKDDNVNTQDESESDTYWNDNQPSSLTDGKKGFMLPTRVSLKEDRCRLEFLTETRKDIYDPENSLSLRAEARGYSNMR